MILPTLLRIRFIRKSIIISWHCLGVLLTYYLAFFLRFDQETTQYIHLYFSTWPVLLAISLTFFVSMKQFTGIWKYYSIDDLFKTTLACLLTILSFSLFKDNKTENPLFWIGKK